jgi:hypothetical protein
MTLAAGSRLGPYEILAPLGAGGMGEVYRALDPRLSREVAIKVLPEELSGDPARLRRFEKEARAASALNHPGIVTIYDVGDDGGVSYIAMELVTGRTLRDLLVAGPLPFKRFFQVAVPLADGLAAAHESGIVHRDLKPENVMVTREGVVKILDFGLAKLMPSIGSGEDSLPTVSRTEPGGLLGTVSYMSPEQAAGQPVDFRSDQFSLGSILYEMATGRKAFRRNTPVDTLAAILHDEPEPLESAGTAAPLPLRWIVNRCLSKEPEERYASTRDLARDLKAIRDHIHSSSDAGLAIPSGRRSGRHAAPGALLAAAALALAAAAFLAGRHFHPAPDPVSAVSTRRLTFRRGTIDNARFAPDGETIVYSAAWEQEPRELYLTSVRATESRPLGVAGVELLSVSRAGDLALLRGDMPGTGDDRGTLARMALTGGAPRDVLEGASRNVDWGPGGSLAVTRVRAGKTQLEYPIGKTIYEATVIYAPRVSPDGESVAFFESSRGEWGLSTVNRLGQKKVLVKMADGFDGFGALAWHPGGQEIWFDATQGEWAMAGLFAVKLSGERRTLMRPAVGFFLRDVSRDGRLLLQHQVYRKELLFGVAGDRRERDLGWLDDSRLADLSRDGSAVLLTELGWGGGAGRVAFLRRTDGSPAVRLWDGHAQSLSPDGKWALVTPQNSRGGTKELLRVPTGAGQPEKIAVGDLEVAGAAWLPDGRRIFLLASGAGGPPRGYLIDSVDGTPHPFGPEGWLRDGGALSVEGRLGGFSPDSRYATLKEPDGRWQLYPVDGGAPSPIRGLEPGENVGPFVADGKAVLVVRSERTRARIDRLDLASGRRTAWTELAPADPVGLTGITNLMVAGDDRSYAYNANRVISDDLYLIEGIR